jgi:dTDP-glucose pyrophosphorylase
MNILIPMAGLGSRFPNSPVPKPLIRFNNEYMIEAVIKSLGISGNYIFIVREEHIRDYQVDKILKSICDCEIISVDYLTEGPACTALLAKDLINNSEPLIITNCDQIMHWDKKSFESFCINYPKDGFVVTYFADTDKNSYAKLDRHGNVIEIQEKQIISNISLNGIHFWKNGRYFIESVNAMIASNERAPNGEFYIGPSYNKMIEAGYKVGIYHIPNCQHWAIGTEDDLNLFLQDNQNDNY